MGTLVLLAIGFAAGALATVTFKAVYNYAVQAKSKIEELSDRY